MITPSTQLFIYFSMVMFNYLPQERTEDSHSITHGIMVSKISPTNTDCVWRKRKQRAGAQGVQTSEDIVPTSEVFSHRHERPSVSLDS